MKEFVLEATTDVPAAAEPLALKGRLGAFAELTKPRITFLIVLTSAAGFSLGSKGGFDYLALFNSLFGIALLSSGIATLNQYMERGLEAWALFAILFAWQFPHFLAIAWMYREDYARAGILMLPVVEPQCRITAQQIVIWSLLLVPVSLFPAVLGTTG